MANETSTTQNAQNTETAKSAQSTNAAQNEQTCGCTQIKDEESQNSAQNSNTDVNAILDSIGQSANKVLMAGIGAVVVGAQKGKELLEQLATKGQESFNQGKDINKELTHKASQATKNIREDALEMRMKAMTPEQRTEFAAKAAEFAEKQNLEQAQKSGQINSGNGEKIDINEAEQAAEKLEK